MTTDLLPLDTGLQSESCRTLEGTIVPIGTETGSHGILQNIPHVFFRFFLPAENMVIKILLPPNAGMMLPEPKPAALFEFVHCFEEVGFP